MQRNTSPQTAAAAAAVAKSAKRRRPLLAAALAGIVVLVLGACADGTGDGSRVARSAVTTTTPPAPAPTTTTAGRATTSPPPPLRPGAARPGTTVPTAPGAPKPEPPPALPPAPEDDPSNGSWVTASPSQGFAGNRIHIEGHGFTDEFWRTSTGNLWLAGSGSCNIYADTEHDVEVTAAGHLSGYLVVPSWGACRQSSEGEVPLTSGTYDIVFQCTACIIGTFDFVASQGPTVTSCDDIWFSEDSEDMASLIVATGVPCTQAESVIRDVGPLLVPPASLDPAYAQGFECSQMFQSDEGLPSATYQCTRGSEAITFVRT